MSTDQQLKPRPIANASMCRRYIKKYTIKYNNIYKKHREHTYREQWAAMLRHPGSSRGFGALLKGLTSVVVLKETLEQGTEPPITAPRVPQHCCPQLRVCVSKQYKHNRFRMGSSVLFNFQIQWFSFKLKAIIK